jgi:ABC-2 type transport system permease protein
VSAAALTLNQARYVNKAFWRNPARAFFTFAFPLMFLVIFTALLGNGTVHIGALAVKESSYYVASMAAFGVITACFSNTAISITFSRDGGVLKQIDGTPLPRAVFFASRILQVTLIALLLVVITTAFGHVAYGAHVPSGATLLRFLAMLLVGSAAFCALGYAITAAIPNADAAAPVVNFAILPLLFLSGIFIPFDNSTPDWILWVARVFPVRHFAVGLQAGYLGTPFHWSDVAVVAGWGIAGLVLAVRFFSWEPRQ